MTRSSKISIAIAAAALLLVGCGGDTGTSPPSGVSGGQAPRPAQRQAGAAGADGQTLRFHVKIDDRIGEEQAQQIRRVFSRDDFGPDVSGAGGKRDPFRSQTTTSSLDVDTGPSPEPEEICRSYVADKYSLRDLKLVGIVLRGTRSYALFVDSISTGHNVRRNDCLGLEKAQVVSIRAGFVTVRISADPNLDPDSSAPQAQDRTIALYPEELQVEAE